MKVIIIGDIVGKPGRAVLTATLKRLKDQHEAEFVIANVENAAEGAGLNPKVGDEILAAGVDDDALGVGALPVLAPPGNVVACGIDFRDVRLAPAERAKDGRGLPREAGRHAVGLRPEARRIREEGQEIRGEPLVELRIDARDPRDLERPPAGVADGVQTRVEVGEVAVDRVRVPPLGRKGLLLRAEPAELDGGSREEESGAGREPLQDAPPAWPAPLH